MSRRLEIELTSQRTDGTWTWRVAGARLPKGLVDGGLVPDEAAVGAVLRAEAEASLDGLAITSLSLPRERTEPEGRLEMLSRSRREDLVTARLTKEPGQVAQHSESGDSRDRTNRTRRGAQRRNRDKKRRHDTAKPGKRNTETSRHRRRGDAARPDSDSDDRGEQRHRPDGRSSRKRQRTKSDRSSSGRKPPRQTKSDRSLSGRKPPRLKPDRTHRTAALAALPEKQLPLAREVLRNGVPGVRQTMKRMNQMAAAEELPQIKAEPLLALAEQLAPYLKAAAWHDRADAALAGMDFLDLRDIRSVVVAAEQGARTAKTRAMAEELRSGLTTRIESDHSEWLAELAMNISENRTVRALRLSSRPPKAGSPLPPDISERLTAMASSALHANASQQRWCIVLDALAFSPVRAQAAPVGMLENPSEEVLTKVRRLASRMPHIAVLFGMEPHPQRKRRQPPPPPELPDQTPKSRDDGQIGNGS